MHALMWLLLPLMMQSQVVVQWHTKHDLKALVQTPAACGKQRQTAAPFEAVLSVRGIGGFERRTLAVDERAGTLTFDNVPPGLHTLRITGGSLPPITRQVHVGEHKLELHWPSISGRVTRNGKPVHARVFRTAITDPQTGRYTALVGESPERHSLVVEPCDGSGAYWLMAGELPAKNAELDIELPANRVDVEVADKASGLPVTNAIVSYMAPREGSSHAMHFVISGPRSDERGRVRLETLVPDRTLRICVRHDDYEHACSDDFQLRADEVKPLRIALTKLIKRAGRVIAPATGLAMISWHGRDGVTETVRTDSQGRFTSTKAHQPGEIITISSEHFFYAFVQPEVKEGQPFEIRVPAARARTFQVHAKKEGAFTIAVGELVVPPEGVAQHLLRDGQEPRLEPGSSRVVKNVLETAPLSIVFDGARRPLGEQTLLILE